MNKTGVKKVITFEEHYICPEIDTAYRKLAERLLGRSAALLL